MKSAKLLNVFVAAVLLATFAAGCKKQPKNITSIPGMSARTSDRTDMNPALTSDSSQGRNLGQSEIANPVENANQDRATLAAQTIYFEYDRSAIKVSEQGKLDAVATYLKSAPAGEQLLIEGHCDERGTEEYNRSLGERRAIAAREYLLQKHGISSEKVTTASFGEDRPASLEKTEEAYAKNRRGEFVILRPQ